MELSKAASDLVKAGALILAEIERIDRIDADDARNVDEYGARRA